MMDLHDTPCEPCRKGAPPLTAAEAAALLEQLPGWQLTEADGIPQLQRRFACRNFRQALELAQRIGALAEEQGHHPALLVEWGGLTVSWWTHKIGGLHRNDFIMAAKTDQLAAEG